MMRERPRCMTVRALILAPVVSLAALQAAAMPREAMPPEVASDRALICFYRGLDPGSRREHYRVRVHDRHVGRLARGSFLYHLTPPGRRIVFVEAEVNVSRSFRVQGGRVHYIRVERVDDSPPARPRLRRVAPSTAARELGGLRFAGDPLRGNPRGLCLGRGPS